MKRKEKLTSQCGNVVARRPVGDGPTRVYVQQRRPGDGRVWDGVTRLVKSGNTLSLGPAPFLLVGDTNGLVGHDVRVRRRIRRSTNMPSERGLFVNAALATPITGLERFAKLVVGRVSV